MSQFMLIIAQKVCVNKFLCYVNSKSQRHNQRLNEKATFYAETCFSSFVTEKYLLNQLINVSLKRSMRLFRFFCCCCFFKNIGIFYLNDSFKLEIYSSISETPLCFVSSEPKKGRFNLKNLHKSSGRL